MTLQLPFLDNQCAIGEIGCFPPRIPIEKAACFAYYFALVMCAEGENKDGADVWESKNRLYDKES